MDKNDVFIYLIHLGYLSYNRDEQTCYIPNCEMRQKWLNTVAADKDC